jgi:glycosyltransferase involved in cell wall biosynthesis
MDVLFSVLISVYSKTRLDHFNECLLSIENQSILPSEVVVVQDGALDYNLGGILAKFSKLNFKVVVNELNLGLPKSLNKGLQECSNEIVFRMDADDICKENRFFIQYDAMVSNPKIMVLGSNVELIDDNSEIINKLRFVPLLNERIRKLMFYKNPFNHPSVVYRKSCVLEVGGYSDVVLYEDWYLWFKLSAKNEFIFANLNENLLQYRIRSFNERSGFAIVKFEFSFYNLLYKNNFISLFKFIYCLIIKTIIRLLPFSVYKTIKHQFDRIN